MTMHLHFGLFRSAGISTVVQPKCTMDDNHRTGTSETVQQFTAVPHHSETCILPYYFLYKDIVWFHIYISLLSSTLLIACAISVVPVR